MAPLSPRDFVGVVDAVIDGAALRLARPHVARAAASVTLRHFPRLCVDGALPARRHAIAVAWCSQKVTPARIATGTIRAMEAHQESLEVTLEGIKVLGTITKSEAYRRCVPCRCAALSRAASTCRAFPSDADTHAPRATPRLVTRSHALQPATCVSAARC